MQIDFGEATVYLSGVKTVVNLFCARLCYSGAPLVLAYRRQNEESFLDALIQVFQYFGGVPKRVIFDNGKVAVKDGFGAHARKQAGYAALAAHYGFEAIFCNCQRREKNNVKRREEIDANAGIKNAGIPTAGCKPPVNCLPESRPGAR